MLVHHSVSSSSNMEILLSIIVLVVASTLSLLSILHQVAAPIWTVECCRANLILAVLSQQCHFCTGSAKLVDFQF